MTLKYRFSLAFTAHTMAVLALFGGAYFFLERQAALRAQTRERTSALMKTAAVCRDAYLSKSMLSALHYIRVLKDDPRILFAACIGNDGIVTAHSDPTWLGRRIGPNERAIVDVNALGQALRSSPPNSLAIELHAPVAVGDEPVGMAWMGFDSRVIDSEFRAGLKTTFRQLMTVAAGTFLLALFLSFRLASSLSRPIASLERAAREIGEGNLSYEINPVNRSDELGGLTRSMARMSRNLRQLDQLKDDFISSVSHDLRSPMAAIRMFTDFMLNLDPERDKLIPRHRQWLANISDNAAKLTIFVTNVLDAAKIKAGRMEFTLQPVDVAASAMNVRALFQVMASEYRIEIKVDVPPDLPKISADPVRFDQVITNLVSNALKFTRPEGMVWISAVESGRTVEITVGDTGTGMTREQTESLFQRFGQTTEADKDGAPKSSGLGLYITKQAIDGMGGTIRVESEPGRGSRFIISMPAEEDHESA